MNTEKLLEEGRLAMRESKTLDAEKLFRQAHEENPQSIDAMVDLAMVGAEIGKVEESRELIGCALATEPAHPLALTVKGIHYSMNHQFSEAAIWFEKAIGANAALDVAYVKLAAAQYKLGLFLKSEENACIAVQLNPGNFEAHFILGHALAKTHKGNEAIREIRESIKINPFFLQGYLVLGSMYSRARKPELAEKLYHEALVHNPRSEKIRKRLFRLYLHKKDYAGAQAELEQIVNIRPSGRAYLELGKLERINGRPDLAIEMLKKSVEILPKAWQPHFYLAKMYEVAQDEKMARDEYEIAVKMNPRSYKPFNAFGRQYLRLEMMTEAEQLFTRAAELDESAPEPQLSLGLLAARKGRVHHARNLLTQLIGKSKGNKVSFEARRLLKTLSGS